jgi:fructokinase
LESDLSEATQSSKIYIFGEILWDCFESGEVLGGAPLNVGWNLRAMGLDPKMISAIGCDSRAERALEKLQSHGMSTDLIAQLQDFATGHVDVTVEDGEPTYKIVDDVAYDHIPYPDCLQESSLTGAWLYHGSLALRNVPSRETLTRLRESFGNRVFVDINIRQPYFDYEIIEPLLHGVHSVKLNVDELELMSQRPSSTLPKSTSAADLLSDYPDSCKTVAIEVMEQYNIEQMWLTAGGGGAAWISKAGGMDVVAAPQPDPFVDAVGAGDSCAAVIMHGLIHGRTPTATLTDATRLASRVCSLQGATTTELSFYKSAVSDP